MSAHRCRSLLTMPGFAASVAIPTPAADVFEVVSDLATHPRWAPPI